MSGVDAEEVRRLIAAGESSRVEFKRGLPRPEKTARTLAAFANTRGGHFLVGVGDRGEVLGAPHPRRTAAQLRAIAREAVEPSVALRVTTAQMTEGPVVVASVGLSEARPHRVQRVDGTLEAPVRIGSSTRAASGRALESIEHGAGHGGRAGLDPLERDVLDWVARQGEAGTSATGRCTVERFAADRSVGVVRARRAFVKLERAGRLLGVGGGSQRTYSLP